MSAELRPDLLVVGAGPAGLSAALAAAQGGVSVLLADLNPGPGGQIWRGDKSDGAGESGRLLREVRSHPGITALQGAHLVLAEGSVRRRVLQFSTPGGAVRVRPGRVVLATGAAERFLPFPGWTLPGVVGAGGLQARVKGGLEIRGARVVVAGSGPLLLAVVAGLRRQGARVLMVAEQAGLGRLAGFALAATRSGGKAGEAGRLAWALRGVPYWPGTSPLRAEGSGRLEHVTLSGPFGERTLACDWLAVGWGLVPDTRAARLLGCELGPGGAVRVGPWQDTSVPGVYAAGELTGVGGVDKARLEGFVAGCAATGQAERLRDAPALLHQARAFQAALERGFALRPGLRALPSPDTIVCRCEDVTHAQLRGCASWTEAKLHTRCGMGPCQGAVCGPATETLYGWHSPGVRPPLSPIPLSELLSEPIQRSMP